MQTVDNTKVTFLIEDAQFKFKTALLSATPEPGKAVYIALHQCYSDTPVYAAGELTNEQCEFIAVRRLLEGNKGHWSPLEQATMQIGLYGFPHSTIQQLLRSRIGLSPAVESFRYTSKHILEAADGLIPIEDVVYLRPIGKYHDREAGGYDYTAERRRRDLNMSEINIQHVASLLRDGMPPEQSRGQLNSDYRQHCIITVNARSMMGILDRRYKKDAQMEIRILADSMFKIFKIYMPIVSMWYEKVRLGKAILAP
jgi:thymidylate synthase (FAD)